MSELGLYFFVSIMTSIFVYFTSRMIYKNIFKNNTATEDDEGEEQRKLSLWETIKLMTLFLVWSQRNPAHSDTPFIKQFNYIKQNMLVKDAFILPFFGTVVAAVSPKYIKTLFTNNFCKNRVPLKLTEMTFKGSGKGIMFNCGDETWKKLRTYTIRTLGQLGFGKNDKMSPIQREELGHLLDHMEFLRDSTGNMIQVRGLFKVYILNTVWQIVGGNRFSENDEDFQFLKKNMDAMAGANALKLLCASCFPNTVTRVLRTLGLNLTTTFETMDETNIYFKKHIQAQSSLNEPSEEKKCFVDFFFSEIEKNKDDEQLKKVYCVDQLAQVLTDLFVGGMDTTSNYLECFLMFMVLNPHVQTKVQQEIDSVIGKDSPPSFATHKQSMPYTFATTAEIHRLGNIFPFTPRVVTEDCAIEDHIYKKGTAVLANWTFLRIDESYWDDAKVFRPERFLDFQNNILIDRVNSVMAFGIGVRVCPGESVATSTIFTFVTGILQRFTISKINEKEFVGLSKKLAPVSRPEPFHVSLYPRS